MIKFGTDGWRAIIADEFTFANLKILSQAIVDYLKDTARGGKKVVIGYDRRFLSASFAQTVAQVLAANKVAVVLSDQAVPTPVVSFHCRQDKYSLGIMITASHNPANFNGLKIKTQEGGSADKAVTDSIEKFLHKNKPKYTAIEGLKQKDLLKTKDLTAGYMNFFKDFVDLASLRKLKLRVLIDTMYGVGDRFVERILDAGQIKIDYLHNEVNPSFGGVNPEPVESNLSELLARVKEEKYDLGIALDGDADRIAAVDSAGNYINAQVLLPLLSIHMVKNRQAKGGIAKTVVGSNLIDEVTHSLGVACYETPVGFKYISNLFKQNLICIGGEEAGGIGFQGYIPERDGCAALLLLLEMMAQEQKSFDALLAELFQKFGRWHYSRTAISVKNVRKGINNLKLPTHLYDKKVERVNTLDGIKLITKDSWLMFRKSGTEQIVRIYAESRSLKEAQELIALGEKMIYAL